MPRGSLRKGVRVQHPSRGEGSVTGTWNDGKDVVIKYDNDKEPFEYSMSDALKKLKILSDEEAPPADPPKRSPPASKKSPASSPSANPDREETSSGFAQGDRVKHSSRGEGTIAGFYGEFVKVEFDAEPEEVFEYTHDDARAKLSFVGGAAPAVAAKSSPVPKAASPKAESPKAAAPAVASPEAEEEGEGEEREPTDSGFAQNDRVIHAKRGAGKINGFFGEFVLVQYDSEPQGQHKYTHHKARSCLTFPDGSRAPEPEDEEPPPAKKSPAKPRRGSTADVPMKSKNKGRQFKKGMRVKHPSRGEGSVTSTFNGGKDINVKYDNDKEPFEYSLADALGKLTILETEEAEE